MRQEVRVDLAAELVEAVARTNERAGRPATTPVPWDRAGCLRAAVDLGLARSVEVEGRTHVRLTDRGAEVFRRARVAAMRREED